MQNVTAGAKPAAATKLKLTLTIGEAPQAAALKSGAIKSDRLDLTYNQVSPIHTSFKPMVRELAFDVCEMAIVTYLMAKDNGKKITLIPAMMLAWDQHPQLIYNSERGVLAPKDLEGKRVGVRAYSQTTGTWVRGFLQNDFGVDLKKVKWVTFEDAHVGEYRDPPWASRESSGKKITDMLLAGEIDACIAEPPADPRIKTVIPDAKNVAQQWRTKNGFRPINHLVVVKSELAAANPWLVGELWRMLKESRAAAKLTPEQETAAPYGIDVNREAFKRIALYAHQQGLVSKLYDVDEMFDETALKACRS
jgi:4,5-dihydroxyphthalate decarboxylase